MYYVTGTNPRHYFHIPFQVNRKEEAIRQCHEWKKAHGCSPEEIEEQKRKDDIHHKALRLIEEGFYDAEIEKKARELIANDTYVEKELVERARKLVAGEHGDCSANRDIKRRINLQVTGLAKELARVWIKQGTYDREVWKKAFGLIEQEPREPMKNPIIMKIVSGMIKSSPLETAKLLGIKEIAYINTKYAIPLSWELAWRIFYYHKYKNDYLYGLSTYRTIEYETLMVLGNLLLMNIKYAELQEALEPYPANRNLLPQAWVFGRTGEKEEAKRVMDEYSKIPMMDRLEVLEDVFITIKKAGYDQVGHILVLIREFANKIK